MKIRPLGDRVLVRPMEALEKLKSGIVLPDSAKEKPQQGEVVSVGEGKYISGKLVPLSVKKMIKFYFPNMVETKLKLMAKN